MSTLTKLGVPGFSPIQHTLKLIFTYFTTTAADKPRAKIVPLELAKPRRWLPSQLTPWRI